MGMQVGGFRFAAVVLLLVPCQCTRDSTQTLSDGGEVRIILDAGSATPVSPGGPAQCTTGACNYQTQEGCDAGLMCHPRVGADQQVTPSCEPVGGQGPGASCTWLGCSPGYICDADGRCRHMCCGGDWSVCSENETCNGAIELLPSGSSIPVPAGVGLCEPTDDCDVFEPTSCPPGQSCYIIDSRGGVACLASGSVDAYEPCSPAELCRSGLTCVGHGNGSGQCVRLCRAVPGGEPSCPANEGMICAHFAKDPPGVGECVPSVY